MSLSTRRLQSLHGKSLPCTKHDFAKFLTALGLMIATSCLSATTTVRLELPGSATQGALVMGRTENGAVVTLGDRPLRVGVDGAFLFGVGRDEEGPLLVRARMIDGRQAQQQLLIEARMFETERVDGVPESTVNPPPEIAERIAREQLEVARARERDDARQDFRFGFIWPLRGRISGRYGSLRILNGTPKNPHYGVDVAAKTGTPIIAPAGGIVSFAETDLYLTGGTVIIDHGHGLSSVFVHLSRLHVALGQQIEQGERLGLVGATGRASGPHMHWGMNWFDVRIDPELIVGAM
ncbi:MAG: M23 family metallopeptidase [Pseudomonadota bacterium]|nr:M23 family metallopeptidase [Pseudomonadota bacterium]